MTGTTRRSFLLRAAALGCSAAASPLLTPVSFAALPGENRLVVIILRGGMDGLDVVRPHGDSAYAALRPTLGSAAANGDLDGFYALHPGLAKLRPLWDAGQLGFAHAVSTPYRDKRSHFDGQDLLEAGTPGLGGPRARDGWLNRLLQAMPDARAESAFAIGRDPILTLAGAAPVSSWSPEAELELSPQAQRLLELTYHDHPLFRDALGEALDIVHDLEAGAAGDADGEMAGMMEGARAGGRNEHKAIAAFAADRLRRETRIAAFSINGWDTHRGQANGLKRPLGRLSETILALHDGLGPEWNRTMVMAMTEFGRTARENGSGGTDHGTGGAMLLAGGALRGGRVFADWPGLGDGALYAGRDLMPTQDVRAYAAWALRGLFGAGVSLLEDTVFPGLRLDPDPGLLA